jgi:hypothetical protein
MMAASDAADLSAAQNQETRATTELMRWSGMRISDAHKFNDSEIAGKEKRNGHQTIQSRSPPRYTGGGIAFFLMATIARMPAKLGTPSFVNPSFRRPLPLPFLII